MKPELSPLLGWLLISTISAHVITGTIDNQDSDTKDIDIPEAQELLGKVDETVLHQVLYTISPHQAHQKNHEVVKRQQESTVRNNTIVVSPSTTTIPPTIDAQGQSTSTITLSPQSSTIIVIVTNPQSSLSVNAVSSTIISSPVASTTAESRTVTSSNPGSGVTGSGSTTIVNSVTSARTSSSPNGSTRAPNAASSITTGSSSSQPSVGPSDPEVVLVTSTLADGQVVTQTSYVGAATATESRGSSTSAPAGALQSPSAAHHDHHPLSSGQWLLIAYATCLIFTMAL